MGGFRHYTVGTDSAGYGIQISSFAFAAKNFAEFYARVRIEPGCKVLFYYGSVLYGSYTGAFLAFEFITVTCVYIGAYRHRKQIPLAMTMLVFFFVMYLRTYNEIRQSIAAAILFMGLDVLENRHYFRYLIYIAAAALFHSSALITLIFFLFFHMVTTSRIYIKRVYVKVLFVYLVVMGLFQTFNIMGYVARFVPMMARYGSYVRLIHRYNATGRHLIPLYLGELIIFFLYRKRASGCFMNKNGISSINFYEFGAVFYIAYMVAINFFDRVLFYNDFANMLVLGAMPVFVRDKYLRALLFMAVILTVGVFWYYTFLVSPTFQTWPYRSVL